jgi:hypothetical protein
MGTPMFVLVTLVPAIRRMGRFFVCYGWLRITQGLIHNQGAEGQIKRECRLDSENSTLEGGQSSQNIREIMDNPQNSDTLCETTPPRLVTRPRLFAAS